MSVAAKTEPTDYDMNYTCDLVDNIFSANSPPKEISTSFWKRLLNEPATQQNYTTCLIFKFISYTYGLGHKPLKEAKRMIKNISANPTSISNPSLTSLKPPHPATRHGSLVLDLSPLKRGRLQTAPGRRKSTDPKAAIKTATAPIENPTNQAGKLKRKSSDGVNEDASNFLQSGPSEEEVRISTKLREILYTIAFVANACDLKKWDFNNLRDVFLLWNKARSWEEAATSFERAIMKRFSKPPDFDNVDVWNQMFSEILLSFQRKDCEWNYNSSLQDEYVGNSIKYWLVQHQAETLNSSVTPLIESIIDLLEKVHLNYDETKIAALLHVFCETIILAPYVPLHILQKAYTSFQILYLLPISVSAAVKEVLDLIQIEIKSPGYFRRTIFFQEQDTQSLLSNVNVHFTSTNIFVDQEVKVWDTLESALKKISIKSKISSQKTKADQQRLIVEQIYFAVFGAESCDHQTLRQALKSCSALQLSSISSEALEVMEQSATMENPQFAQEFVREKLEGLSNKLMDELENESPEKKMSNNEGNVSPAITKRSSNPPPTSVIAPARNNSYLSRSISSNSMVENQESSEKLKLKGINCASEMNYPRMEIKSFDRDQISTAIFELVRTTAKDFLQQKRRSGSQSSTAKRNEERRRSAFRSSGDVRDSGVVEDIPEDATRNKHNIGGLLSPDISKSPSQLTTKDKDNTPSTDYWENFSASGFSRHKRSDNEKSLEELLNSFRLSCVLGDDESSEIKDFQNDISSNNTSFNNDTTATEETLENLSSDSVTISINNNVLENSPKKAKLEDIEEGPQNSKSKKHKHRFKTLGRKGIKFMRGIRRTSSMRAMENDETPPPTEQTSPAFDVLVEQTNTDHEEETKQESDTTSNTSVTTSSSNNSFLEAISTVRWRTTSLPLKQSLRVLKKSKNRRTDIKHVFSSVGDVRLDDPGNDALPDKGDSSYGIRNLSTSSENTNITSTAFNFDALQISAGKSTDVLKANRRHTVYLNTKRESSHKHTKRDISQAEDKSQVFMEDDESRNRMDSGIVADKSSEVHMRLSPGSDLGGAGIWEETGVAGVKLARKQGVRRNRKSRYLNQVSGKTLTKKVLKLAFVGNDKTVGDVARAYYELKRRELTRAPLLHQIDLRIFYIPVGENAFSDETRIKKFGVAPFDLEIAEMLGSIDPWYRSVVASSFNNLLRVQPSINKDDIENEKVVPSDTSNLTWDEAEASPDNILASGILGYLRFAIRTAFVPIFQAEMRSSTDEIITEVFCCRVEIGSNAYKQAIAAGRFGKVGKLVDLTNDTGPPAAYTTFNYIKYGINGACISNQELPEVDYHRVRILPIALSDSNCKDQVRFPGADGLHVTLLDNEKRMKLLKRGIQKGTMTEEKLMEKYGNKFTVSSAKLKVVRPVQGTFTVSLDHNLIYTSIKSIEIKRCLSPEYERQGLYNREMYSTSKHLLSLPLKIFWPNSIST